MTSRHPLTWAVVSVHAVVLLAWSWLRHQHFGSHALDLGAYQNVFWHQAFRGIAWNGVEHQPCARRGRPLQQEQPER